MEGDLPKMEMKETCKIYIPKLVRCIGGEDCKICISIKEDIPQ
jgi:hypothetical protein